MEQNKIKNILNFNSKCYSFKYIKYSDGLFNKTVNATYVIHLKGNNRYENVISQLKEYRPTNDVYILLNDGYKKCNKTKNIVYPADDLIDAFFQIFKHASEKNYENILILEDDFIFTNKIKNQTHIQNINNFLNRKKGEDFIYYLGCIPWLFVPTFYDINTYFNMCSSGMHSVIYSKKYRELCMKRYFDAIYETRDWDILNNLFFGKRYAYYTPLCYQLFEQTENNKNWGSFNPIFEFLAFFLKKIFNSLNLDKSIEPGYSILYVFSKLLFLVLVLFFVYIIIKLKNIFMKNKYVTINKK